MRTTIGIFIFLISQQVLFSQVKEEEPSKDFYMSVKTFRTTVSDTVSLKYTRYIIRDGDTLIPYKRTINDDEDLIEVKYVLKDTSFLNVYKSIAFRSVNSKEPQHRLWKNDIYIYFGNSVPKKHQRHLRRFIRKNLGDIKYLNISTTRKLSKSNFIIYYEGDTEYEEKFENNYSRKSQYYTYWNNNRINKARIKMIPEFFHNEEALLSELIKNFISNIGYFNSSSQMDCESVFSDCASPVDQLSLLDKAILKYHYSYGFCVAMGLESFEEQDAAAREFYRLNPGSDYPVLYKKDDFPTK